jgi:hypothetical protein
MNESLRSLLETLPRSIEPPEDLWPAVQGRLTRPLPSENEGARAMAATSSPLTRFGAGRLAAAALLLVIASSTATYLIVSDDHASGPTDASVALREPPAPIAVVVNEDYERVERDLTALLDSQRKTLQPETVAKVERNLAIIDNAIAEIRQALAADPTNRALHDLLRASYGQKAALIQQASRT